VLAAELAPGHAVDPARSATMTSDSAQRPPHPATQNAAQREQARSAANAAADCSVGDFTSKTGAALVEQIKQSETTCINTLFSVTGEDAKALFREEQMITVANAFKDVAATYPGDNSTFATQVVLYLRAGYYIQYNQPENVGEYGPTLKSAIQGALDAFFGSSHAFDVTEANGEPLAETVTLIDSSEENARYLDVVKRLQKNYNSSYDAFYGMLVAVNNTYTVLFRGHQMPEFAGAVKADPSVLTGLRDFAVVHDDLLGTDRSYLASNAGRELGRFLQHADLKDTVKPLVKELLGRSQITGRTAPLWVGLAEMTDEYDKENCAEYDTCDLQNRVRDAVLTVTHACGPSVKILAQELTASELSATCDSVLKQDPVFHDIVKDNGPVKDDNNTSIEIVAFNSSTDYKTYAGAVFGIDTDNGGMYLEGDPAAEGNQPRFIAYEQPAPGRRLPNLEPQPRVHPLPRRPLRHVRRLRGRADHPDRDVDRGIRRVPLLLLPRHHLREGDRRGRQEHLQAQPALRDHLRQRGHHPYLPVGLSGRPLYAPVAPRGRGHPARPLSRRRVRRCPQPAPRHHRHHVRHRLRRLAEQVRRRRLRPTAGPERPVTEASVTGKN
jgi:microbial collagenase